MERTLSGSAEDGLAQVGTVERAQDHEVAPGPGGGFLERGTDSMLRAQGHAGGCAPVDSQVVYQP
jgi:hypothetical protein